MVRYGTVQYSTVQYSIVVVVIRSKYDGSIVITSCCVSVNMYMCVSGQVESQSRACHITIYKS